MRMGIQISFWLLALLLLSACGLTLGSAAPDACDAGGSVLFADDFSGAQNCGWVEYNRGGAIAAITDDVMRITSSQPGQIWWTNPGRTFDDVVITVQAEQISGLDDNAYGVICRYQDEENFYVFLISGDGYYAIGKYGGERNIDPDEEEQVEEERQEGAGRVTYLTGEGQFVESSAINQGAALNQLQVRCVGNELSLAVNGEPLATVNDSSFPSGDVGLGASTFQPGMMVIEFDNILVQAP